MISPIKIVDRHLGKIICSILSIFKRDSECKNPSNILIIQLWGIGETVLALPAIKAVKQNFPGSEITVLATKRNNSVVESGDAKTKLIDMGPFSIIKFMMKNYKKYDLVIDMEEYLNISAIISLFAGKFSVGYAHAARSKLYSLKVKYNDKQHVVQTFLDLARALKIDYYTDKLEKLKYSKNDKEQVDQLFKKYGIKKGDFAIGIAPGAAESAKSRIWPLERYSELADELILRHKGKILLIGTKEENDLMEKILKNVEHKEKVVNLAGQISLSQLFYLAIRFDFFIGNDSGPMHIAAAQGVKTLGLFGPNLPVRFGPYGKGNIGLYKGYNCEFSPCINVHLGQVPDCLFPKNSNDYQKCMKNISVNDVLNEVEKMI